MEIELTQVFRAIKRFWWMPLLAGLALAIVVYLSASALPKTYASTVQIMVPVAEVSESSLVSENMRVSTYREMAVSGPVLDQVIETNGLDLTRADLAGKITTATIPGTNIFTISVRDEDPEWAAMITNSVAEVMVSEITRISLNQLDQNRQVLNEQVTSLSNQISELDARIAELQGAGNAESPEVRAEIDSLQAERLVLQQSVADINGLIRKMNEMALREMMPVIVVDQAQISEVPESPKPLLLAIVAGIIGAIIGAMAMLALQLFDRKIRDNADVEPVVGQPILANTSAANVQPGKDLALRLAAHIAKRSTPLGSKPTLAITTLQNANLAETVREAFEQTSQTIGNPTDWISAGAIRTEGMAVVNANRADGVVLVLEPGRDTKSDVKAAVDEMKLDGTPIIAAMMLK